MIQIPKNLTPEQKAKIEEIYQNLSKRIDTVISLLTEKSADLPVMASEIEQVRSFNIIPTIQMTLLSRQQIIDILKKYLLTVWMTRNDLLNPEGVKLTSELNDELKMMNDESKPNDELRIKNNESKLPPGQNPESEIRNPEAVAPLGQNPESRIKNQEVPIQPQAVLPTPPTPTPAPPTDVRPPGGQ